MAMSQEGRSDALVLFGVTGDLAHKKIFPALYDMARRGALGLPVVGVASSKITLDELRRRAAEAIRSGNGADEAALGRVLQSLRYVSGDYNDAATFQRIREALGGARQPT